MLRYVRSWLSCYSTLCYLLFEFASLGLKRQLLKLKYDSIRYT